MGFPDRRYFTLGKSAGQTNDDAVAVCRRTLTYAMSDGASACYDGRGWARALARAYVRDRDVTPSWLDGVRRAYLAGAFPSPTDWLAVNAFDRGSFATLLGFRIDADRVSGFAMGDTVLLIQSPSALRVIPDMKAAEFSANPILLSSHRGVGAFRETDEAFAAAGFSAPAPPSGWMGSRLLAMTDGLALWALTGLEDGANRVGQLGALTDRAAFVGFVREETTAGRMRRDDATLIILDL